MAAELKAFQLDPVHRLRVASNKLYQHRVAVEVDLHIPRTVVTNDDLEVHRLAEQFPGGIVSKMHEPFTRHAGEATYERVLTTRLDKRELTDLNGLDLCPMIFQEDIPKKVELRVIVVGNHVFAGELDHQADSVNRDDWRVDQNINVWRSSKLPEDVTTKLLKMMTLLGLNYGAVDMILTPDGRYVFLEVNVQGMYSWIEEATGLPISAAIADLLVGATPPRV